MSFLKQFASGYDKVIFFKSVPNLEIEIKHDQFWFDPQKLLVFTMHDLFKVNQHQKFGVGMSMNHSKFKIPGISSNITECSLVMVK